MIEHILSALGTAWFVAYEPGLEANHGLRTGVHPFNPGCL